MNTGRIIKRDERHMLVELDEPLNENYIELIGSQETPSVKFEIMDERMITRPQQKLIYALLGDIARWSGYDPLEMKDIFKVYYMFISNDFDSEISLGSCSKSEAGEFIHMLIEFVLKHNVPMKKQYEELLEDNYYFYCCVKYRRCCVCGKSHADIHHIDTVGMGRNRRHIDHTKHALTALCREHHNIAHNLGVETFMKRFKVLPVYLSQEDIKRLRIGNITELEEKKAND